MENKTRVSGIRTHDLTRNSLRSYPLDHNLYPKLWQKIGYNHSASMWNNFLELLRKSSCPDWLTLLNPEKKKKIIDHLGARSWNSENLSFLTLSKIKSICIWRAKWRPISLLFSDVPHSDALISILKNKFAAPASKRIRPNIEMQQ